MLATVAITYVVLVLALWLPFGPSSGMPYETALVYNSETSSWWDGFFYVDPLRVYTNVFYHVSFLLGSALTYPGDFTMYQVVYAALWWARGFLAFLIVHRLMRGYSPFAYLVGALVLVHASDGALNWVGQLNQFGMIFWMMLSFYFLLVALQSLRATRQAVGGAFACLFAYFSLWSYESQLFMIGVFPLIALWMVGSFNFRRAAIVFAYWIVPATYALLNYIRYFSATRGLTYQHNVMRTNFTVGALWEDFAFNVGASLRFWEWADALAYDAPLRWPTLLAVAGAAAILIGYALITRVPASRSGVDADQTGEMPPIDVLLKLLCAGAILLVFSFPVYLLLNSARSLWRTQFLSGFGAALVLGPLAGLLAIRGLQTRFARLLPALSVAIVAAFGVWAAYKAAWFHYRNWERHRLAIAQVLEVAPSVRSGALVVLTEVPRGRDPFGDNMWFDMAMRLAYPNTSVSGAYYLEGGVRPPGLGMEVRNGNWTWNGTGYPPLLRSIPFENTIIIRYDRGGRATLVERVPSYVIVDSRTAASYNPRDAIDSKPATFTALRRYLREPAAP